MQFLIFYCNDEDIKNVARYIIANPLRAGLATNLNNYPLWNTIWV